MDKIALIYGFNANKSANVAKKIAELMGDSVVELNAETLSPEDFGSYSSFILGVPTWFDGELPNYWDEFVPALEDMDLKGKKFAIYGLGDQAGYPENFVDAIGLMAGILEAQGGKVIGFTSTSGYTFERSKGVRGQQFTGLAIDTNNQPAQNKQRIVKWVEQLKGEF